MRLVVLVGVLAVGCLMTPVVPFGKGKTARQSQHDVMQDHVQPGVLDTTVERSGDVRSVKIRVHADDAYRSQHVRWQDAFGESLQYANVVLAAKLGIELHPEYLAWDYHAPAARLEDTLRALTEHDPGEGAFAVIALTSSLPLVSATFDELGVANLGGKHAVLRGHADLEERKAFESSFPDLDKTERENTLEARRRHKTTALLLHELGHNLGVEHDAPPDTIMSASYSRLATSFTPMSLATMAATVAARAGGRTVTAARSTPAASIIIFVSDEGDVIFEGNIQRGNTIDAVFAAHRDADIQVRHARDTPAAALEQLAARAKRMGATRISISAVE
jgi:hypothetical protein